MNRMALKILMLALAGLMLLPVAASATWPGGNGKIFFSCRVAGTGSTGQDICVVNADGSGFVNLTNSPVSSENIPDVSRDGSQITYTSNATGTLLAWAMNADGSNQHQVTTIEADGPAWTPDGRISYRAKTSPSTWEFQTIASTGGASTLLLSAGVTGNVFAPRWATDGTYLYTKDAAIPGTDPAQFAKQIYTVGTGGETEVTHAASGLTSNQQPSWSPDGSKIVFWRTTGVNDDIWVIPSTGGVDVKLTTSAQTVKEAWPQYSPDGTKLVWDQYDTTVPANDFFHKKLVIASADGSAPVAIPTPSTIDYAATPVWATGTSSPPPAPIAAFDATAPKKVKKGKTLSVTLRCTGDTQCVVTYSAVVSVPGKGKKPKTFKIKAKTVTLDAKATKIVKLTVPSSAKKPIEKALKNGKKPTTKTTAAAKQPNGGPTIRTVTLSTRITS